MKKVNKVFIFSLLSVFTVVGGSLLLAQENNQSVPVAVQKQNAYLQTYDPWKEDPQQVLNQIYNLMNGFARDPLDWNEEDDLGQEIVFDEDDKYHIHLNLPGVGKENISLEVKGKRLIVKGTRSDQSVSEDKKHYQKSSYLSSFEKTYLLTDEMDVSKIEAIYEDGVLQISIPQIKEKKEESMKIKVN